MAAGLSAEFCIRRRPVRFLAAALAATLLLSIANAGQETAVPEKVKQLRLAAEQGDALAQYNLGVMYAFGEGVPENDAEAVKWYRLAAEQGNAKAQGNLGVMYSYGEDVPQDYVQAHKWFNLAALGGNIEGQHCRADVSGEMSRDEIAEAQRRAREWLAEGRRKAA